MLQMPQHKIMLSCDFYQGKVVVTVCPALPMNGVTMILGNDIERSGVWADVSLPAIIVSCLWSPVNLTGMGGISLRHSGNVCNARIDSCAVGGHELQGGR